jgi:hypothetical protein
MELNQMEMNTIRFCLQEQINTLLERRDRVEDKAGINKRIGWLIIVKQKIPKGAKQ